MKVVAVMTSCPYKIPAKASLDEALKIMDLRNIRHLPVIDDETLVGLVSERDLRLSKLVCDVSKYCPTVGEICTVEPLVVKQDADLADVAKQLADLKLDCALVEDNEGNFVGIFTTTDAWRTLHLILEEKKK